MGFSLGLDWKRRQGQSQEAADILCVGLKRYGGWEYLSPFTFHLVLFAPVILKNVVV